MNILRTTLRTAAIAAVAVLFAQASLADDAIVKNTLSRSRAAKDPAVDAPAEAALVEAPAAAPAKEDVAKLEIGEIKSVTIKGSTAFAEDEGARAMLEQSLVDGKVKTVGDLQAAIDATQKALFSRGFYLAAVYPASADAYNEKTGDLALIVDSGKFGDVKVTLAEKDWPHWYSAEQVEKRLKGIDRNEVFNYTRLRSALSDINGHPDLLSDTKIAVRDAREGDKPDSPYTRFADLSLDVEDSFPLHFIWDVNNYGMEDIDEWQTSLTVQYLNLTRADDVLTVTPATSFNGDLFSVTASYVRPFDWLLGMRGTVYGGYSDLTSDDILPTLALEGTGYFAGLNWSANLYDSDERNVAFNIGAMYRYIEDEWSRAIYKLKKREIGILPLTAGFSYADKKGDWLGGRDFINLSVSYNLDSFEDALDAYTEGAEKNYLVFRPGWYRLQPLFAESIPEDQKWRAWSLFTRVEGQFTDNVLISSERLAYGGYNCLRGYRTRGYLGDNGVFGTAELRTPVLCDMVAGLFGDRTGKSPIDRLQLLVFSDLGWISYKDPYPNMEKDETLFSAGIGARLGITKYTSLNCDLAFPLRKAYAEENDDDMEVYLSVKVIW